MIFHIGISLLVLFLSWFTIMLVAVMSNGSVTYINESSGSTTITLLAFLILILGFLWIIVSAIFGVPFIDQVILGVK